MMESSVLFEANTSWPFPVLQYTVKTSYVEVRKASGIAYILLQLISNLENNSEKLVATLKSLGVPNDIHYIFAEELSSMISYGIIRVESERNYSSDSIDLYNISDFKITDLGKKLFAEGTIPTGNNKIKELNVYYDVSKKNTQIKFDGKLFRLYNSMLDESCVGDVVLNNPDIEMFINDNMNKYAFRKGERISGFEHKPPEILVYKIEDAVTLKISQDGAQLHSKDKVRDTFIHKFYSGSTITKIINAKKKYHFPEFIISEVKEYEFNMFPNVIKFYMPSQLAAATNIKCTLSLDGKCKIHGSECSLDCSETIELMQTCDIKGAACYFQDGNLYSVVPGRFLFEVDGYNENCSLNLIAVQQLDEEVKQKLMQEMLSKCIKAKNPIERCIVIKKLTRISKCKDYLNQFADSLLCEITSITDKIDSFIKLNDEFCKEVEWNSYANKCAEQLFEEMCSEIDLEGFTAKNVLGRKLNKIMNLHDFDYLRKISKNLVNEMGDVITFEALESAGYNVDVILSVVNVFKLYCNQILEENHISGKSLFSRQCALLGQSLSDLRNLTGIDNPYEDSAELDFDNDRFVQLMATFSDSMKKLKKYETYAPEQVNMFIAFQERFTELKKVVSVEREAMKNPININKQYIEQMLKKSKYKDAICDLHVRLQFELNRLFNRNNASTFDLLSDLNMKRYLDEKEINSMHLLRKCRNEFQHPKAKRDVQYSERIIREWCSVVEKLGGISNELRGEN